MRVHARFESESRSPWTIAVDEFFS